MKWTVKRDGAGDHAIGYVLLNQYGEQLRGHGGRVVTFLDRALAQQEADWRSAR